MKIKNYLLLASALALILSGSAYKKAHDINIGLNPVVVTNVPLSANTQFGNILTNNKGFALCFFSNDVHDTPACVNAGLLATDLEHLKINNNN